MKISIYFLFYVAMILELLIFIVDRDEAEQQVVRVRDLKAIYSQKLQLLPPQQKTVSVTTFTRGGQRVEIAHPETVSILVPILNLVSESERRKVTYTIIDQQSGAQLPYSIDTVGNCIIQRVFTSEGTYHFSISAKVTRTMPDYLPKRLRSELQKELTKVFGDSLLVPSNSLDFEIVAREQMRPLPPCPC